MTSSGMRVDLHVHSKSSTRPSQWYLNSLNDDAGPVDGVKGEKTISAVMLF